MANRMPQGCWTYLKA